MPKNIKQFLKVKFLRCALRHMTGVYFLDRHGAKRNILFSTLRPIISIVLFHQVLIVSATALYPGLFPAIVIKTADEPWSYNKRLTVNTNCQFAVNTYANCRKKKTGNWRRFFLVCSMKVHESLLVKFLRSLFA